MDSSIEDSQRIMEMMCKLCVSILARASSQHKQPSNDHLDILF